jgi:hypothetical protein
MLLLKMIIIFIKRKKCNEIRDRNTGAEGNSAVGQVHVRQFFSS